jgi:DNA topoisomerase-2
MTKEKIKLEYEEKKSKRNISDFLNLEYKNYGMSVVEDRAIPSAIDGFKPGARKIMHAALTGSIKDGKLYKLLALSGDTMRLSLYAHGDGSLNGTIVNLCRDYIDNLNPLESDSQVGSLRCPDSAGSPRYLYVRHSKNMDLIYKTDYDLLDFIFDEGQYLEPQNYLPIIPTVLAKNNQGIAVGYAMHNTSCHPLDLIDACLEVLSQKKEKPLETIIRPYIRGIKQSNWRFEDGVWMNYGEWKFNASKDLMLVTDLPADVSYEDFEKLLNSYVEKDHIKTWRNNSEGGGVNYEIIFPKKRLEAEIKKDKSGLRIARQFKLVKQVPEDLLWLLDENHKLKYFTNKYDVVKYFVNYRLTKYEDRKKRLVKILQERFDNNDMLVRFIELVCKGKLKIRNRSKADIKVDMDKEKLPLNLISTPMSKCTIEERDELLKQNEQIKAELEYIKKTTEKQMYVNDLKNLRKELEKEFSK